NRLNCYERVRWPFETGFETATARSKTSPAKIPQYWRAECGKDFALHAQLSDPWLGFEWLASGRAFRLWRREEKLLGDVSIGTGSNQGSTEKRLRLANQRPRSFAATWKRPVQDQSALV